MLAFCVQGSRGLRPEAFLASSDCRQLGREILGCLGQSWLRGFQSLSENLGWSFLQGCAHKTNVCPASRVQNWLSLVGLVLVQGGEGLEGFLCRH